MGRDIAESIFTLIGIALVGVLILTGAYMAGAARAHDTRVENDRQITCIDHGGHMERVDSSNLICKK